MATQTLRVGMALADFLLVKPVDSQAPSHAPPLRYQVSIEKNVPSTMRDGTVLRSDIHHPRAPGRFPALLPGTPYSKKDARASQQFGELAGRGLVVVIQDTRGRYMADGEAKPHDEAQDGFGAIAWAARLSYANRKVEMFGGRYLATTQLLAATLKPPALGAVHSAHKISDFIWDAATWSADDDGHQIVTVNVEKSKDPARVAQETPRSDYALRRMLAGLRRAGD
jgi:putative CocE/NonD family hydrolase